jgi:hypothetical protein
LATLRRGGDRRSDKWRKTDKNEIWLTAQDKYIQTVRDEQQRLAGLPPETKEEIAWVVF